MKYLINLEDVNSFDLEKVGGKNASLGEMIQTMKKKGIKVPQGFATTADAYREFLSQGQLDKKIYHLLASLNVKDLRQLKKISAQIKRWIIATPFLPAFENEVTKALRKINKSAVAVRSSATAEDLPSASFAGQQETYLNVRGRKNVLTSIKEVYASLFTSRSIAYRIHQGYAHKKVAISVGIQPMIRSDKATSGVIFTLDTESGFDQVILITATLGLGEALVQGRVSPDEFYVFKPSLEKRKFSIIQRKLGQKSHKMVYSSVSKNNIKTVSVSEADKSQFCLNDKEVETLAAYALKIEKHYRKPMDIEWAKDGPKGQLFILQARPETVKSRIQEQQTIKQYTLAQKGKLLTKGQSIGQGIGSGAAMVIRDPKKMPTLRPGTVLVTDMTDPDWEPIMKKAAAIVTNRGGRTCHAAIVARELGIPAVIGCGDATSRIKKGEIVTVSCAEGQIGHVYSGKLAYHLKKLAVKNMPKLPVKLCINIGSPEKAFNAQFLPNAGVGLARLEFIINNLIGIHPNTVLKLASMPKKIKQQIKSLTSAYTSPIEFYTEKLREGISMLAASFYPKEVIFRFSDFKSDEYRNLLGGYLFEENEENPLLGFRGAARYRNSRFVDCFELECEAFKRVRERMGLMNAQIMIPFVRTVSELQEVIQLLAKFGLKRGQGNLKIYMMCEIPSNVILAKKFLKYIDGFSIGSNDLTSLILGLDRNSSLVADLFDERNEAIKISLHKVIKECNKQKKYIGICGQAPSDHLDFAEWLMREGIQVLSLSPDSIVSTWLGLAKRLKKRGKHESK